MRNLFLVCVLSIAFASVSSGAGQKPGTYTPVPLRVTVHSVDSAGHQCAICPDGAGDYIDGQKGVKATIDQYGNVIIDFQTTRTNMRWLHYQYPAGTPIPPGDGSHHYFSTIKLDGRPLQTMATDDVIHVASCPLFDDPSGQLQYRHAFYRDCQSGVVDGVGLVVTRTNSGWDVEPEPGALAWVFSITTTGRTQVTNYGLMSLPFSMTLTPK